MYESWQKVSGHFEYLENRSCALDVIGSQSEEIFLCIHKQSLSRGSSQWAVRRCWPNLCTVYGKYIISYNWRGYVDIQDISGRKVNILGGHSIGHYKQKVCMYLCPIPNDFRVRDISLYSSLNLAPNSVLSSRRNAPLSEECASLLSVGWPVWLVNVMS
jgi:hypothetical protein